MTIVFMFVLFLNCLVIFAADALLGNSTTLISDSTAVVTTRTPILASQSQLSAYQAMALYSLSPPVGDGKRKVVPRKGILEIPEAPLSLQANGTKSPSTSFTATLDNIPTSASTIGANQPTSATAANNLRSDTSVTSSTIVQNVSNISSSTTTPTTTSTTSGTTTAKTTPPTTSQPIPHKPKITYSVANDPHRIISLDEHSPPLETSGKIQNNRDETTAVDAPHSQPSREFVLDADSETRRRYIIPVVTLLFAIPIVLAFGIVATRRFKSYWATRHYRRMDFLVDGMYNT